MYEKQIDDLLTALDIINKFESGDSLELKTTIRTEIKRLEEIDEKLCSL